MAVTDIDQLQIKIKGSAQGANRSVNTLIKNLDRLQASLTSLDTSKLNAFSENSTKASNGSKKLSTSLNNLNVSANKNTKSFKGLASAFGRFYANYFLVVRGIKGLWSSVESTADYIESFNYYTVAFGKIASEWDKDWENYGSENAKNYSNAFVTSMNSTLEKLSGVKLSIGEDGQGLLTTTGGSNLGLNIQEITQYASQLASVTNSLGQTGKTSLAISSSFTKLAGDISSLFNVDYSTVANNLQSGLIGQSRALYKYGIDITNATLQTYAYELGLEKTVAEMTQMEKQQLRVLAILDQSEVAFGDLANTINSPSNMIRQLTNNLKESSIILGQLFMPVVENVLPMINGLSIAIKQLLTDIASFMGISIDMDSYGQGFNETEDSIDGVTDGLDEATESANKLKKALRPFDNLNLITTSNGAGYGLGGTIDLTQQIVDATEEYESKWKEAFDKMENRAEKFSVNISKALEPIKKIIQDFAIGDYFQAGQDVSNLVISINEFLSEAIKKVDWKEVGDNIGDFLAGIDWEQVIKSGFELTFDIGQAIADVWLTSFDTAPIETAIISALAIAKFTGIGSAIAGAVSSSISATGGLQIAIIGGSLVFGYLKGQEKADILKEETELRKQYGNKYTPSEYAIMAASKADDNSAMGKIAMNEYINEAVDLEIRSTQLDMIGDFFTDLFDNMSKLGLSFTGYATGGVNIPEDGWFRASKGEYFGHFDDGTSVIANQGQIISGISNGVVEGNREQNALLREQNSLLRQILAKDMGITPRDAFNAVKSEANNYKRRTGQPAFG